MKYNKPYQITYSDCDENQRMQLTAMIDLMMQTSDEQLSAGDASIDELANRHLGWVVTQYHFEIKHLPKPMDKVVFSTTPVGYNRFFSYRNFALEDEAGNNLVEVTSMWVLFDLEKRKMIPSDPALMASLDVPELKKMPRFSRIRPKKDYQKKRQYRVRFDDLDTNHHLTNSHYFNWFIDMLERSFLKEHEVSTIDVKFDKELQYGQEPFSCVNLCITDDAIKTEHVLQDEAGNEQAVCELTWRKLAVNKGHDN